MKKGLKKGLIGLLTGATLVVGTVGCNTGPQKDFFGAKLGATEKRIAVFPPGLPLMALHGGQYNFKKITDSDSETIGYDISYHRWTESVGLKLGDNNQKIRILNAKNMSIKQDFLIKDRFEISYELNGQKRLNEYHLGFAGDQCKLANQYIFNEKKEKIKVK